ncbi:MAG TPA: hypothetical protein VHR84_20970 [Terriglobales bacterium]|jgi:hypothetical protein|nr:hypothetical protein [Terriglobales bacterium]
MEWQAVGKIVRDTVVSNTSMRMRCRLVLCIWGASLFSLVTYHSVRVNKEMRHGHSWRYYWWGSVRLDSDLSNKHPNGSILCNNTANDCWDPEYIWVTPGWLEKALLLSALPAFVVTLGAVRGMARAGVNEVVSFMFTMPVLGTAWFYSVGWLLDRRRYQRNTRFGQNSTSANP